VRDVREDCDGVFELGTSLGALDSEMLLTLVMLGVLAGTYEALLRLAIDRAGEGRAGVDSIAPVLDLDAMDIVRDKVGVELNSDETGTLDPTMDGSLSEGTSRIVRRCEGAEVRGKVETLLGLIEGDPEETRDGEHTSAVTYSVDGEIAIVEGRDELGARSAVAYTLSVFCEGVKGSEAVVNDVLEGVRGGPDAVVYRVEGVGVVAPESCGALTGGLDPLSGVNSEMSELMQRPYATGL
jgi:hypothetical protein